MTRHKAHEEHGGRSIAAMTILALALVFTWGCLEDERADPITPTPPDPPEAAEVAESIVERDLDVEVSTLESDSLRDGNTAFALDLYRQLRSGEGGDENIFFSPHSMSIALAMTYAGAEGETEREMAEVMHYGLPEPDLHQAFNALDLELASRSVRLDMVNATWGQVGWDFLPEYLDTLALNYGASMYLLDFAAAPEASRTTINAWVAEHTEDRIEELLAEGMITPLTRLVLTNAIYFNAAWQIQFDEEDTSSASFFLDDGSTVSVDMMSLTADLNFAQGPSWAAVELPYEGGELSMVAVLPTIDDGSFEDSLDLEGLDAILDSLSPTEGVEVRMPRFTFGDEIDLDQELQAMGMVSAFDPLQADFSGMDGRPDLYISQAVHKAWIEVTEQGTEASAATAVVMDWNSAPLGITLDRPFFFLIRDIQTNCVLFIGRVADPTAQ